MSPFQSTFIAVGVLTLTTLSLDFLSQPSQEVISECACWCMILTFGNIYFHFKSKASLPFNASRFSLLAFSVTILCIACSSQKPIWSTAPLLAPGFSIIEKGNVLFPEIEAQESTDVGLKAKGKSRAILLHAFTVATMVALFRNDLLYNLRLKIIWLAIQVFIYWTLSGNAFKSNTIVSESITEVLRTAIEMAQAMVLITVPLVVMNWSSTTPSHLISIAACLKVFRWICVLILAHESKLFITSWIIIFTVCTNAIRTYPQGWQAGFTVFGSLVALYRVATTFQKSPIAKYTLLLLSFYPISIFLVEHDLGTQVSAWYNEIHPETARTATWYSTHHPIARLAEAARATFEKTQLQQSKSLKQAVAEYTRRYGRPPPPGFDDWYHFALANDVQLIDEYDYLTKSMEPFWQMPPSVLRDYVDQALAVEDANFNTLIIDDHRATLSRGSFQHAQLIELLQPVIQFLPNLKAALNEFDEPRVLVPFDTLPTGAHSELGNARIQPVYFVSERHQKVWDSATLPCPPSSLARAAVIQPELEMVSLRFISNLSESQNICLWSASESIKHGFLATPSTFHYTQRLVPILATAKLSTFQDIMIPSSYYFQGDISSYDESKDLTWEEKKNVLYWRGSGTGGHWDKGSWKMGHRQRFVNFTNSQDAEATLLNGSSSGEWIAYPTKMSQIAEKFKVHFSEFKQCETADCNEQEAYFHKVEADSNDDAQQYKILYNLDGNSFSGRYYRFLKSNSLVFMQAIFKEWHDDRLIPWVHFVPISLGMQELPEATRYFLDDPEGRQLAARMAGESRNWARRILRPIDLTVAYFRVFLEYARLLDEDRDTKFCC